MELSSSGAMRLLGAWNGSADTLVDREALVSSTLLHNFSSLISNCSLR